jgi:hypothetical protein
LFFDRLAAPGRDGTPDFGVIYSPGRDDLPELVAKFQVAEQEAGSDRLPVLIVCGAPAGEDAVPWAGQRKCVVVDSPVSIDRVLSVVCQLLSR